MRHGKSHNHLGRKTAHRKALLRNLTISLIRHKRISTTLAKAKALRMFAEPLLTKSKANTMHARRSVFDALQNKEAIKELFAEVAPKIADRPGGYLRIIRTGTRLGDNAETALIELVDFNADYNPNTKARSGKTRRSRRGGRKSSSSSVTPDANAPTDTPSESETAAAATAASAGEAGTDLPAGDLAARQVTEGRIPEVTMTDQIVDQNDTTVADGDDAEQVTDTAGAKDPSAAPDTDEAEKPA